MPRKSNKDRIAEAAEEARLKAEETKEKAAKKKATKKATKKVAKKKATTRSKAAAAADTRMKVVWSVCDAGGGVVKSYPYPEKAAAEAEVKRLTAAKSRPYRLRGDKVPMD